MSTPDTLARVLSVRVDLRDVAACAEISPEMMVAYFKAHGWALVRDEVDGQRWHRAPTVVIFCPHWIDYGGHVVEVIAEVAEAEGRSPLAVWVDMMDLAAGEKTQ